VLDLLTILCLQLTFAQDGIILEEFSQMFLHFVIQFMFIMTSYMPCNRQHRKIFYRNTKEKKLRHKHAQGQFACNNQLCWVFIDKKIAVSHTSPFPIPTVNWSGRAQVWQQVKAANPGFSICEIGATIGRMWRELSDEEKQRHMEDFTKDKVPCFACEL